MNMPDIEEKFHMRRYSISEIDALRSVIYQKCDTGFYFPTQDEIQSAWHSPIVDPKRVEEQLRTMMFAGLTVSDIHDTRPDGYAIQRSGLSVGWLDWSTYTWTDNFLGGCITGGREQAVQQITGGVHTAHHTPVILHPSVGFELYRTGKIAVGGETYTLYHVTAGPDGITLGNPVQPMPTPAPQP